MPGGDSYRGRGVVERVVGARSGGLKGRVTWKKCPEELGAHLTRQLGWMWPRGCFLLA